MMKKAAVCLEYNEHDPQKMTNSQKLSCFLTYAVNNTVLGRELLKSIGRVIINIYDIDEPTEEQKVELCNELCDTNYDMKIVCISLMTELWKK
jgi:hypothetical protein